MNSLTEHVTSQVFVCQVALGRHWSGCFSHLCKFGSDSINSIEAVVFSGQLTLDCQRKMLIKQYPAIHQWMKGKPVELVPQPCLKRVASWGMLQRTFENLWSGNNHTVPVNMICKYQNWHRRSQDSHRPELVKDFQLMQAKAWEVASSLELSSKSNLKKYIANISMILCLLNVMYLLALGS